MRAISTWTLMKQRMSDIWHVRVKVIVLNIPKSYSSPAHERPWCIPSTECGTVRVYEQ